MPLYNIWRTGQTSYEELAEVVVKAKTAKEARKLASKCEDSYHEKLWLNPKKSKLVRLKETGKSEVIVVKHNPR